MKRLFVLWLVVIMVLSLPMSALAGNVVDSADQAVMDVAGMAEDAAEIAEEATAEPEEESPAISPIIEKLAKLPWYIYVLLILLVAVAILMLVSSKRSHWNSRRIAMGAICIAMSFVLSCIRLYRMPQGGSITPGSMLPLVLFMLACGPLQGFVVGCAYGLLKLIADPYIIHPIQMLVDYPFAYAAMIMSCIAMVLPMRKAWKLPVAVLLAGVGRYIMAVLSGAVFFAEYAGEQNAWIYSLGYNISYLGLDTLVCMVIACIPGMTRLVDMIRRN